jgi:hypothetical protein
MRRFAALPLLAALASLSGCLAYMPPDECPTHLEIRWRPSFEAAQADAKALGRPILLVTAAGDITGFC